MSSVMSEEIIVIVEPPLAEITVIMEPTFSDISVIVAETGLQGPAGPAGPPGPVGGTAFEYQMPIPQTTAVIDHHLGRDPVAVQVFDGSQLCDEYSVVFTIPGEQVTIGFDVSVAAFIRLL